MGVQVGVIVAVGVAESNGVSVSVGENDSVTGSAVPVEVDVTEEVPSYW